MSMSDFEQMVAEDDAWKEAHRQHVESLTDDQRVALARRYRDREEAELLLHTPVTGYRDFIRHFVDEGTTATLRWMRPFRDATDLDDVKRIAEGLVEMSDDELDRLRESLTSPPDPA